MSVNATLERKPPAAPPRDVDRRGLLIGGCAAIAALAAWPYMRRALRREAPVFVARNQS